MGLLPPCLICLARTLCHFLGVYRFCFPGRSQRKTTPRVMGPKPKNFKPIFALAVSRSGQDHVQPRGTLSLDLTIPLKKRDTLSTA